MILSLRSASESAGGGRGHASRSAVTGSKHSRWEQRDKGEGVCDRRLGVWGRGGCQQKSGKFLSWRLHLMSFSQITPPTPTPKYTCWIAALAIRTSSFKESLKESSCAGMFPVLVIPRFLISSGRKVVRVLDIRRRELSDRILTEFHSFFCHQKDSIKRTLSIFWPQEKHCSWKYLDYT